MQTRFFEFLVEDAFGAGYGLRDAGQELRFAFESMLAQNHATATHTASDCRTGVLAAESRS